MRIYSVVRSVVQKRQAPRPETEIDMNRQIALFQIVVRGGFVKVW